MVRAQLLLLALLAPLCAGLKLRDLDGNPAGGDNHSAAKDWWNHSADRNFQHLDRDYVASHAHDWDAFLPQYSWQGKKVLDYGIGAGYLGERLFSKYSIGAYYGLDIFQKSLDAAGQVLQPWQPMVHLLLTPQSFADIHPDIFVTQQVIQHFPTVEYLKDFLNNVDTSGAQELMLQYRMSANGNTTATDAYRTGSEKAFALVTSKAFVQLHLPRYEFQWATQRPMCCGTTAEYTGWKLRQQ